ncbi:hypothetical protein JCM21900_001920 [Sporobolomyces salmonicolor]
MSTANYPSTPPVNTANPVDLVRFTQETVHARIREELSPTDRLIAASAEDSHMRWARTGFWLGTMAGAALAFRSRLITGRQAVREGQLPRLFYSPKTGPAAQAQEEAAKKAARERAAGEAAGEEAAGNEMRQSRAKFIGKGIGYGILGSVVGTNVGAWYGRNAAERVLQNSGRADAIHAAQARGIERAAREISAATGGKIDLSRGQNHARGVPSGEKEGMDTGGDIGGVGYREPESELSHETQSNGVGYSDRAPPQDHFSGGLSDSSPSINPSSPQTSRWEELRRSRATPPSRWDVLRENNARANAPGPSSSDSIAQGNGEVREDVLSKDSREEKERRRREFDAMMEREARGGDDSMEDKAWR